MNGHLTELGPLRLEPYNGMPVVVCDPNEVWKLHTNAVDEAPCREYAGQVFFVHPGGELVDVRVADHAGQTKVKFNVRFTDEAGRGQPYCIPAAPTLQGVEAVTVKAGIVSPPRSPHDGSGRPPSAATHQTEPPADNAGNAGDGAAAADQTDPPETEAGTEAEAKAAATGL